MTETKDKLKQARSEELTTNEIARAMTLATQACDGFELSDEELEALCDSLLCEKMLGCA